jgi:succinate dehydrogenase / fumarate reductase cytochrome b subunit
MYRNVAATNEEAWMGLKRNVRLKDALRYQGKGPMLTYFLHRIGGLGIVTFVGLHVLASFVGGTFGSKVNLIYEHWAFQIFMFFCVLFHVINGLRIVILDLVPRLIEHQREAIWVEWAVFLPIYGLAVLVIARTALGG